MRFRIGLKGLPLGMLLLLVTFTTAAAEGMIGCPVTLAWDASPDSTVKGYVLYFGVENSIATNRLDVGSAQSVTLTNLYAYSNYFFFATAYNSLGIESVPSGSLFYRPPAITRLRISRQSGGANVLQFRSAAGSLCQIEHALTPDSQTWHSLAITNADARGNVVISDTAASSSENRFYRAVRVGTAIKSTLEALAD